MRQLEKVWKYCSSILIQIPGIIQYYDNKGQRVKVESFSDAFYKPDGLYEAGMLDHIFRGMIKSHTQAEDLHVNEEMTNKMFMNSKYGFGLDLVAQIIQQVRFLQNIWQTE